MLQKELKRTLDTLGIMKELEMTVGQLYRTCGETWAEDKEFWSRMEQAELKHARNIDDMIKIMQERPESFELGHPFRRSTVHIFISSVRSNIERLEKQDIAKDKILFVARDIEESLLESKYGEIVRSSDIEFQTLMKQIVFDTKTHKDWLNEKIAQCSLKTEK